MRQVTEQHGGTAAVLNAPDGGAVFTLRLPLTPAAGADADGGEAGPKDPVAAGEEPGPARVVADRA